MAYPSLSGSDYFHLLIDRKMKRSGMAGNISRVHLELDEKADLNILAEQIGNNGVLQEVSSIRYRFRWPFLPKWEKGKEKRETVVLRKLQSRSDFRSAVLNERIDNEKGLVRIDLCALENGSKHAFISMHHALFDHQGMMNFIRALNGEFSGPLFRESEPHSVWKMIRNAGQMNLELFKRSVWNLGSFLDGETPTQLTPEYRTVQFTKAESETISINAWKAGSRIGESAFHISVVAQAVFRTLKARNGHVPYLWFSVPHNQRKLGTKGHLLSNKLSFLFFRLNESDLGATEKSVSAMLAQLKTQIRSRATEKYIDLMKMMRLIPMPIYGKMVSVPSRGRLSSFGFSDLGEDQLTMKTFCGAQIKAVFRYPPVPSPPGFNVATVKTESGLQMIFAFGKELFHEQEVDALVSGVRAALLTEIGCDT